MAPGSHQCNCTTITINLYIIQIQKNYFITVRKQSYGKVMFSQACVKNSVHRGVVQAQAQGGLPRGGCPDPDPGGGIYPGGMSRPRPRGCLPMGCLGTGSGGSRPRHVGGPGPGPEGGVSQDALRQTPPADDHCCRRYASYWNTFLFKSAFV